MIALALLLAATQPPAETAPGSPNRSRFENVATPEEDVPIGSRVQREADYVTASERDAAWTMHRFAECLVRTRQGQMLELLATRLNSPEQNRIVRDVIGWRSRCLQARSMQIDNVLLRGAVAEALHRQELRGRSVGRLDRFGRCMMTRYPDTARALIGTRPGSREERTAMEGISPRVAECLPPSPRRARHPLLLRGAIAEAFYLDHQGLLPAGGMARQDSGTPTEN